MFMGLKVEKDCRPSSVAGSQSTIVFSILYYIHVLIICKLPIFGHLVCCACTLTMLLLL